MVSAAWIGILTSISPCPLATNIAAVSFIGQRVARPREAVATGLLYGLGRSLAYVAIAAILVRSLLSAGEVSHALQRYMTRLLGPLLVVVGMLLLGLVRLPVSGAGWIGRVGPKVAGWGAFSGLALGVLFALSFCPVSAALYFGSLMPLAVRHESSILLPALYGVGTALPVFVFAVAIAAGTGAVARAFDRIAKFERRARAATGLVFVVAGIVLALIDVWGVP